MSLRSKFVTMAVLAATFAGVASASAAATIQLNLVYLGSTTGVANAANKMAQNTGNGSAPSGWTNGVVPTSGLTTYDLTSSTTQNTANLKNYFAVYADYHPNNAATDATYDNYVALPEPPTSLSITQTGNEVWVSWPVGLLNYTLQSNSVLPGVSWTSITNGITQSSGQYIYKTIPSTSAFYRLMTN